MSGATDKGIIGVGLIGFGTIGTGVVKVLRDNAARHCESRKNPAGDQWIYTADLQMARAACVPVAQLSDRDRGAGAGCFAALDSGSQDDGRDTGAP